MKILLAVSAGIDSMYMAMRSSELFSGASFAVAHCNFSLRGSESDADEDFVREWCGKADIQCFVKRFDTIQYAERNGISIEMAARQLRYDWFTEVCISEGFDAVAVAHNANDNAETLILNLLRGTGGKGIRGMGQRELVKGEKTILLLRPLLDTSREQILTWMQANGGSWREDSSNASNEYKRNLIRNNVFPLFGQLNPSFVRTLNADMERFAQIDDIAQDYFDTHFQEILSPEGHIEIKKLLALKHWEFVLWKALEGSPITHEEFSSLLECLKSGRQIAGKRFGPVLGASGRLEIDNPQSKEATSIGQAESRELLCQFLLPSELDSLIQPQGVLIADADKLVFPLKIRNWQKGDWMCPLGMKGKKKLSDIMTEMKWSLSQKQAAQVIELEGSHVAALLCEKIDNALRVSEKTEKIIRLSFKQ